MSEIVNTSERPLFPPRRSGSGIPDSKLRLGESIHQIERQITEHGFSANFSTKILRHLLMAHLVESHYLRVVNVDVLESVLDCRLVFEIE